MAAKRPKRASLAELVNSERNETHAALQLWGEFPECGPKHARDLDWLHVLQSQLTDVMEHARLASDPEHAEREEYRILRRCLAGIVATCEAWDKQLA